MSVNQTIEQLYSKLQAEVSDNQFAFTNTLVDSLPIQDLLNLIETKTLLFHETTITKLDDSIAISGKVSLLGANTVGVTATFTAMSDAIEFDLSATLPTGHAPGAAWLELQAMTLDLKITTAKEITGTISGTIHTTALDLPIVLSVSKTDAGIGFSYTLPQLDFTAIASAFMGGVALPAELPNFVLLSEGHIVPQAGVFSLSAASTAAWSFPANSKELSLTKVDLQLGRTVAADHTSQLNCAIAISGAVPKAIADELTIQTVDLTFELAGSEWLVKGSMVADLFEHEFSLAAAYRQTAEERTLILSAAAAPAVALVNIEGVGKLSLSKLELEVTKAVVTAEAPATSAWKVSADGAIVVNGVLDVAGNLTVYKKADQSAGLVFTPEHATATILLPPQRTASMNLEFGGISIVRSSVDTATPHATNWVFQAAVDLSFHGWHPTVHKYLPDTIQTTFNADRTGVTLMASRVTNPFEFHLPNIDAIELGDALIDVSDLLIHLGKDIHVAAALGVGLPSKLNNLFGVQADGTPSMQFFNTYDAADAANTTVKLQLSIGTAGIKVTPESSFIKAIHLVNAQGEPLQPDQEPWWFCDLGEFGAVKLKVPDFTYETGTTSFKVSGAFETIRPLSLPMTPFKQLLSACKLQGAADALPKGLPLNAIKILDDQGNFKAAALTQLLQTVTAGHLPAEVTTAIDAIAQNLDQLPDRFKQYLNVEIPPSFAFEIAVTPEGTVQFNARTDAAHPIRVLFPGLLLGIPVLNGITLRSLSFGELAGGSLFLLKVDADVDQFDIASLGAALLSNIPNSPLPSAQHIQRRLVLDNLFTIIVYQTVIPIPIPMFYDQIGIEYWGLEGMQFQTHAQLPMPSLDLREAGTLLSNFKKFFNDRAYLLDPKAAPDHLDLKFSLKQNFLQLPPYLGGNVLGDRQSGPTLSLYENLARLLNGMKTLSVNELIQAVPPATRIDHVDLSFGPLSGNLGWMVTTPDEFKQIATQPALKAIAYQRLGLTDHTATSLVTVLPPAPSGSTNEQGLVVFLKGSAAISNLASFETVFGLAASTSMGFNTGFKLTGKISEVMTMNVSGRVSTPSQAHPTFQLNGQSNLTLLNKTIFQGDVQMSDRRFQCQGTLDLYGLGGSVGMTIDRDQGAELRGDLNAIDLGIFKLSGINGKPKPSMVMQIRPSQLPTMDLAGAVQLLGIRSETRINVSDNGFLFSTAGSLFSKFSATMTVTGKRLNNSVDFRISATMQNDLRQWLKAEATKVIQQAAADAQAKISAQQKQVDDAQAKVNALNQQIDAQRAIVQGERNSANQGLVNAKAKVNSAQNTVNSLNNQINGKKREISDTPKYRVDRLTKLGVELAALYTALKGATAALTAAQAFLNEVAGKIVNTPIDLDVRVSGLIGSRDLATGTLQGYKQALELTKRGVAAGASAGDYIARHGLDALLAVNAASFTADLRSASGGQVAMQVNLTYKGSAANLTLNFNFNDALSSARQLGQTLLQA